MNSVRSTRLGDRRQQRWGLRAKKVALLVSATFVLALGHTQARAQPTTESTQDGFTARVAAVQTLSFEQLLVRAADADPLWRQCAVSELGARDQLGQSELRALAAALADAIEPVRLSAAAGLMRIGKAATRVVLGQIANRAELPMLDLPRSGLGPYPRTVSVAELAVAVLLHSTEVDTDLVIDAYLALPDEARGRANRHGGEVPSGSAREGDQLLLVLRTARLSWSSKLVEALRSPHTALATVSASRLGDFTSHQTAATHALEEFVRGVPPDEVLVVACHALAKQGLPGEEALRRLAVNDVPKVRKAAFSALPLQSKQSAELLVKALDDVDADVAGAALRRIGSLVDENPQQQMQQGTDGRAVDLTEATREAQREKARVALSLFPPATVERLEREVDSGPPMMRMRAITALAVIAYAGQGKSARAGDKLVLTLEHEDTLLRDAARNHLVFLSAQGVWPSAKSLPQLLQYYAHTPAARHDLLPVIAGVDVPEAERGALAQTVLAGYPKLSAEEAEAVVAALAARRPLANAIFEQVSLSLVESPKGNHALLPLLRALRSNEPRHTNALRDLFAKTDDPAVRREVAMGLAYGGASEADVLAELVAAAKGNRTSQREDAARALVASGDAGVASLLSAIDSAPHSSEAGDDLARVLFEAKGRLPPHAEEWVLSRAKSDASQEVQLRALDYLPRMVDQKSTVKDALQSALGSSEAKVRGLALSAWEQSELPLDGYIRRRLAADPDPSVRARALDAALVLEPDASARGELLKQALGDKSVSMQSYAVGKAVAEGKYGESALTDRISTGTPSPGLLKGLMGIGKISSEVKLALKHHLPSAPAGVKAAIAKVTQKPEPLDRNGALKKLDSLDRGERLQAARCLQSENLWADDARLLTVMQAERVHENAKLRLELGLAAQRPAGAQQSGQVKHLPAFPWPAPPGYVSEQLGRESLALTPETTFKALRQLLIDGLRAASDGFTHGVFTLPRDGFALVARMERVHTDGRPRDPRWIHEGVPKTSFFDFLADLFFEEPGYFRMVVFVVTNDFPTEAANAAAVPPPEQGWQFQMPPELGNQTLGDRPVLALVYSFKREGSAKAQAWKDGAPTPVQHLKQAGIWGALKQR